MLQSESGQVGQAVETALDAGYKHIDCAWMYMNEKEVGAAIKKKLDDKTIKREDLFVTSKVKVFIENIESSNSVLPQ